jgi:hypothetical protein
MQQDSGDGAARRAVLCLPLSVGSNDYGSPMSKTSFRILARTFGSQPLAFQILDFRLQICRLKLRRSVTQLSSDWVQLTCRRGSLSLTPALLGSSEALGSARFAPESMPEV